PRASRRSQPCPANRERHPMSTQPETLERSVLERKEREELQTIAGAMGVKASARASKATLIDHILREAGVETADEKPRRARRSAADANGESGAEADVDVAAESSDGGDAGGGGRAADA